MQTKTPPKNFLYKALLALSVAGLYFFLSENQWASSLLKPTYDRRILAKEFTLPLLGPAIGDEGEISLSGLKGEPTVISFWASWCNVCRGETPQLLAIGNELKAFGLQPIVAIASYDSPADVRQSERFLSGRFRVALDKKGEVAQLWKVRSLPHTFVLDRDGTVRLSVSGALTEMKLQEIRQLLAAMVGKTAH